ncbi:unnamed protein product [Closterium sp. NIES-53]
MIHTTTPHFLWPFAVQYAAHQLNLWPHVSLPETSPTLCWTGEVGDASVFRSGDLFYHPTSRRVFPSQDVTFDESVSFYRLFPCRSAPPPPPPLFLAPGPPPVDPLPPQGPAPSGVSQVDPLPGPAPIHVAVDSGASRGAVSGGAEPGGAGSEGAETGGAEPGGAATGGAEPGGVEPGIAALEGAESGGAEPQGAASSGGSAGASLRLSPQQLRDAARAGGTGVAVGAGVTGGTATTGPGGARTRETGAAGTSGVEGAGAGVLTESGTTAGGAGAGGAGVGGPGAGGAGAGGPGVGGAGAGGAGAVDLGSTVRPRPYFIPLLQQSGSLTERREPASRPVSPVQTARRVPRLRPPPVPGMHAMTLCPSSVPLRVPLPTPPESSLPEVPNPESDRARAATPTVSRLLTTAVTDPSFESSVASALVAELLDFTSACRLDYATALVAESASARPPSVAGKCAFGTDVLEDRQEDIEVKRLSGSPPAFKARYVARGFSQRQGVDYFQTFSPTSKMTSLRVLLHVAALCDYELHSLDLSTAFLQGSVHKEIWTTLAALVFARATADPSLFLHSDTSLPLFYVLVYIDDLVFAIADTEALTLVKSELQKRHTCTDLGELRSYLGLQITQDRARPTITLTLSHMVHQVLHRFGFQFSSPQPTPLSTSHSLSAPPLHKSVEPSGPYLERVGCLMYLMTCTRPDLAYPLSLLARYVAPGRHRKVHWDAAKRVLRYLCSTSGMGLVLGGRGPVVLTGHADASWRPRSSPVLYEDSKAMIALCQEHRTKHIALRYFLARELQQRGQLRLAYVATQANTPDVFTNALPPGDHQRFVTVLGLLALFFLSGLPRRYELPAARAAPVSLCHGHWQGQLQGHWQGHGERKVEQGGQQWEQRRSVTYMPRPGESAPRTVTLLPGDGIGPLVADAVVQVHAMCVMLCCEGAEMITPDLPEAEFPQLSRSCLSTRPHVSLPFPSHLLSLAVRAPRCPSQVLAAMRAPVQFEVCEISGRMPRLPAEVLDSLHRNGVGLKGGLATPVGGGVSSLNMRLRQELDLFANLVFCHDIPIATARLHHHAPHTPSSHNHTHTHAHGDENSHVGAESPGGDAGAGVGAGAGAGAGVGMGEQGQGHAPRDVAEALQRRPRGVNIVVVRENTEGEYSGLEHEVVPGVIESLKVVSRFCSERIARYAFQYAYLNGRRAVTVVHKANVMKISDGLFLDSCRQVAQAYPQLRYSEIIVDNCCMQLVRRPQQFDVMVTPNLYGSLVANTAAGICGGSYLMPGGNVGDNAAVFEQGASAGNVGNERMVSERTANPTALLLSAAMMLHHLHLPVFADRVEGAMKGLLAEGAVLTPDMGGRATTQDMVDAIVDRLG